MQTPSPQDRPIKRVIILAVTLGVLLGIVMTMEGFSLIARFGGVPFLAEFLRGEWSNASSPYSFLILGATMVLVAKLFSAMYRPLDALASPAGRFPAFPELLGLILGIYSLVFGGILAMTRIFSWVLPGWVAVFLIPGGFVFSLVLFAVLDSRRRRKTIQH